MVFNKKTTEWMLSYDGRKEEPVTLPVKFPLLLAQGADLSLINISEHTRLGMISYAVF